MQNESWQYFSTPELTGLLQQLKHLSLFSADALVVEGGAGSGKTSLIESLRCLLNEQIDIELDLVQITLVDEPQLVDVLAEMLEQIGLDLGDRHAGAMLSALRSYAESLVLEKRVSLLILDDAHFIKDDALGAILSLLNGANERGFGLRVLMFSDFGLMRRIDQMASAELSIYDFQIPAFSTDELNRFLSERLDGFGALQESGKLPSLAAIWNRSGGFPGPALNIVETQLDEAQSSSSRSWFGGMPILHLGIVSVLMGGLILSLVYQRAGKSESNVAPQAPQSARSIEQLPPPDVAIIPEDKNTKSSLEAEFSGVDAELVDGAGDDAISGSSAKAASMPTNEVPSVSDSGADDLHVRDTSQEADPPNTENKVEKDNKVEMADSKLQETHDIELPNKEHLSERSGGLTPNERFLLDQPEGAYVLQLVAASKKESLIGYVDEQPNKQDLFIYRRKKDDGGYWYIVVIGPYENKQAAQNARAILPSNQRKAGPWPKSVLSVKQEIAAVVGT